ncbi:MAG: hypothetical protein HYX67_07740 [Candidatus Melainabacteria bacterium]|nr:hypothetical protein [Candidatus Melainabacteria bacterium]
MSDFSFKNIENELSVTGRVALATPGKILDEVQNDWAHDKTKLFTTTVESAAIGFATAIAFKSAPGAALLATSVLAGLGVISKTAPMFGDAWNANSDAQRDSLVNKFSSDFGRTGATIAEGLPGFALGGKAGSISLARSEAMQNFAYKNLTKPIEFPLQEKIAFRGPGATMLPEGAIKAGSVDALKLSETLTPQAGVERARSLDLQTGKASRIFVGKEAEVTPKFEDRSGRVLIHTHPLEAGPRPGLYDIKATQDLGIIRSGDYRTFYIGQKGLGSGEAQLKALILDDANKQAFLLHNQPGTNGFTWQHAAPQYVEYEGASASLRSLDVKNAWSQFEALPKVPTPVNPEHVAIAAGQKLGG